MNLWPYRREQWAVCAWVILHFYTCIHTFFENWYYTYTTLSWFFLGIWLLGLLVLDVRLYFFRGTGLLRGLKWYWGVSTVVEAGGFLLAMDILPSGLLFGPVILCSFLTPMNQLMAFSWLLFYQMAGLRGDAWYRSGWTAGVLFCLIHFAYAVWLHHRAKRREEISDESMGAGA